MCTVTYIPLRKNDFILTSNRDESSSRKTTLPKTYVEDGVALTYPKDEVAGGTWIGLSEKKRLVCLLNGGFKIHKRAKAYKMSRGIIVKELLKTDEPVAFIQNFDFSEIEPFTIVLVDWLNELIAYELVWTGDKKYFTALKDEPKIWSSSTLYDDKMQHLRKQWFDTWLKENKLVTQDAVTRFHQDETKGSPEFSLKMKRDIVETVSVTTVEKNNEQVSMSYINILEKENVVTSS